MMKKIILAFLLITLSFELLSPSGFEVQAELILLKTKKKEKRKKPVIKLQKNITEAFHNNIPEHDHIEFLYKLEKIAKRHQTKIENFLISFYTESGFSSSVVNDDSGASGIFQAMHYHFKGGKYEKWDITIEEFRCLSAVEQLDYFDTYLKLSIGENTKINSPEDVYLSIFCPKAVVKQLNTIYKRGQLAYTLNKGLDYDKDGIISRKDIKTRMNRKLKSKWKTMI